MNFLGAVPWTSWMGDLVDETKRPIYFGMRNKIANLTTLIGIIVGGLILQKYNDIKGFIITFTLAAIASAFCTLFLTLKTDIPFTEDTKEKFNLLQFTKRMPKTRFGKFTIFNALFYASVFIAAPFFTVYEINVLNLTYIQIMIALAVTLIGKFLFSKPWGMITEKYGSVKVLSLATLIVAFMPFLWVFFIKHAWQVYLANFLAGIGWAGYELLSFNYIFETVTPPKRSRCTSYMTLYKGIAILIGGLIGTYILKFNPKGFMIVFALSGIARLVSTGFFSKQIKELKDFEPIPQHKMLFQLVSSMPREGLNTIVIGLRIKKGKVETITDPAIKKDL